jgi:hypothetical protein
MACRHQEHKAIDSHRRGRDRLSGWRDAQINKQSLDAIAL